MRKLSFLNIFTFSLFILGEGRARRNPLLDMFTLPPPPKINNPNEFKIGAYGLPIMRAAPVTDCRCTPAVYTNEWCPKGMDKKECEELYVTLPNDSPSVFVVTEDKCTLHFECGEYHSLYGNVFLPLGVYPEPSNLQKEIKSGEKHGMSVAFECNTEGKFELVFISSRRRVVFGVEDLACVRRNEHQTPPEGVREEDETEEQTPTHFGGWTITNQQPPQPTDYQEPQEEYDELREHRHQTPTRVYARRGVRREDRRLRNYRSRPSYQRVDVQNFGEEEE